MEVVSVVVVLVLLLLTAAVLAGRRPAEKAREAPPSLRTPLAGSRRTLAPLFGRGDLDEVFWSGLEETLVAADVGVEAAVSVVERVRARRPVGPEEARALLAEELLAAFPDADRTLGLGGSPAVIVVVGVNGTGKTTSIAKLATRLREEGRLSVLGCADTFRAAAGHQLKAWADRLGLEAVVGEPGADPAAVAFDAYRAARARGRRVVIVDTAGRLHSEHNLMEELAKVVRVLGREAGTVDEVLLVLDATMGQNAIAQARRFAEAVGVTGIILAKMDGTARGGVVVAVERELGIPVKFVGVGERPEDLVAFEPKVFVDALLA